MRESQQVPRGDRTFPVGASETAEEAGREAANRRWEMERAGAYEVRTVMEVMVPGEEPEWLAGELKRLAERGAFVSAPRRVKKHVRRELR